MKNTVVSLSWVLKDSLNHELGVSEKPADFFIGGIDLLPAIESALLGKQVGDSIELYLAPEQAFGDYNELLVFLEPRSIFQFEIEEGMVIESNELSEHQSVDMSDGIFLTITEIYPEHVVLDGNHPLAGMSLRFSAKLHAIRSSSALEQSISSIGESIFHITAPPKAY